MKQKLEIDISLSAIWKIIFVLVSIFLVIKLADIIIFLFVIIIITAALNPIVSRWAKVMPRQLSVLLMLFLVIGIAVGIVSLLVPPTVKQIADLSVSLPSYLSKIKIGLDSGQLENSLYKKLLETLPAQFQNFAARAPAIISNFVGGVVSVLVAIFLIYYLLLEEKGLKTFLFSLIPGDKKELVAEIGSKISAKIGDWFRGELILMTIIGVLDTIILFILGVPYALVLGIWAGLTELIPYVGPWLGALPAIFFAFTISPFTALMVVVLYAAVQQLEANFLVPRVMQKTVGLSPIVVILSLMIGGKLFGLAGIILAVPVAAILMVIKNEWHALMSAFQKKN